MSEVVNKTIINSEILPREKQATKDQEAASLPEREEAVQTASKNDNHAFTEDFDEDLNDFEKSTLFSFKFYKVDVHPIQTNEVHDSITVVLDTDYGPNLVGQDVIHADLTSLIRPSKSRQGPRVNFLLQ